MPIDPAERNVAMQIKGVAAFLRRGRMGGMGDKIGGGLLRTLRSRDTVDCVKSLKYARVLLCSIARIRCGEIAIAVGETSAERSESINERNLSSLVAKADRKTRVI